MDVGGIGKGRFPCLLTCSLSGCLVAWAWIECRRFVGRSSLHPAQAISLCHTFSGHGPPYDFKVEGRSFFLGLSLAVRLHSGSPPSPVDGRSAPTPIGAERGRLIFLHQLKRISNIFPTRDSCFLSTPGPSDLWSPAACGRLPDPFPGPSIPPPHSRTFREHRPQRHFLLTSLRTHTDWNG